MKSLHNYCRLCGDEEKDTLAKLVHLAMKHKLMWHSKQEKAEYQFVAYYFSKSPRELTA